MKLLKQFQAKAGCSSTQYKAGSLWRELHPYLEGYHDRTISYTHWLRVAWAHADMGEGRQELDYYCNKLEKLWLKEKS